MKFTEYLIKRGIQTVITILAILVLNYIIFNMLGNPIAMLKLAPHMTPRAVDNLMAQYHIPQNPFQFPQVFGYIGWYIWDMLTFNWGISLSIQPGTQVTALVVQRAPWTLLLVGISTILSYAIGILIGIYITWKRGKASEFITIVVSLFFYSIPVFFFALLILLFFGFDLHWIPLAGLYSTTSSGTSLSSLEKQIGLGATIINILWHFEAAILSLTIISLAGVILLMRQAMLEAFGEDYILTAKAKGLTEWQIMRKHAAKNAMLPVVTSITLSIGGLLGGALFTEEMYSLPGMGLLMYQAVMQKDLFVLEGTFFLLALTVVFSNLAADLVYGLLDPRVKA